MVQPARWIASPNVIYTGSHVYQAFTPRVVLTWHADKSALLYASFSEGFRSGFGNFPDVKVPYPGIPDVDPDKLYNYEIGTKIDLFDRKLSLEAAVYYIDWKKVQNVLGVPVADNSLIFATASVNGSSARGIGYDLGATYHPTSRLTLNANVSVNYLTQDAPVYFSGILLFNKGDRLVQSPKYTGGGNIDYTLPIGGGYQLHTASGFSYTSKMSTRSVVSGVGRVFDGDNLLIGRANLTLEAPANWSLMFYVNNFTNEQGKVAQRPNLPASRLRPRMYGVEAAYHF